MDRQSSTVAAEQSLPPLSRSHHHLEPPPTTFVQADTATFKHVVQMLTGSSSAAVIQPQRIPPIRGAGAGAVQKKPGFKLYERRNTLKNGLMITPPPGLSPRKTPEILSPSLALSPVTPMTADTLGRRTSPSAEEEDKEEEEEEEEKAIAEKKFYFHPSPRTAAAAEPQLLPLFPVTSPRTSSS